MALPESFVKRGLEIAKEGITLFGGRLVDLSPDELLAACVQGWAAERKARENAALRACARADLLMGRIE
jgi:hypothetical protein